MINFVMNNGNWGQCSFARFMLSVKNSEQYFVCSDRQYMDSYDSHDVFYVPLRIADTAEQRRAYITPDIVERVKNNSMTIVADCSFEGNMKYIRDWWHDFGEYYGFEPKQVIVLIGNDSAHLFPEYNVINVDLFELKAHHDLTQGIEPEVARVDHKKFVFLNNQGKPHRLHMVLNLMERDLLKHSHWSLRHHNQPMTADEMHSKLNHELFEQSHNFNNSSIEQLAEKVPYSPDEGTYSFVEHMVSDLHTTVEFAVVTETIYEKSEGLFLTEKTFKPLVNGTPFVICGQPGSIQKLRNRGFDVYDYIVDHSYDLFHDKCRAEAVADEVERLCSVDFTEYQSQIEESAKHNQKLLCDHARFEQDLKRIHDQIEYFISQNI